MGKKEKLLIKLLSGNSDSNLNFNQIVELLIDFGFEMRVKGSHHILYKTGIVEIINIQPLNNGKAKAYQIKQIRNLIIKYNLVSNV